MIDPSLRAVLRSRYTIRRFFGIFGLLLAVLLLSLFAITAYAPLGAAREASTAFLGNFSATVAVFIVVYGFYVLVTSPELRNAEVIPLRDVEIGDRIIDLPASASDYWFWGRSGSYFRTAVVPGWMTSPAASGSTSACVSSFRIPIGKAMEHFKSS